MLVGLATILNIVFAVIDIISIVVALFSATCPLVGILFLGLFALAVYSLVDAIFSALFYFELGQTEYAAHILLDAVINIATLGLFKLIKKFAPAIGKFWDNIIEKLKNLFKNADNLSKKAAKEVAEKSGEKAVKEADEIAKNLKKSNISDEVIEAAAKDSGKEGLEKLSKAAEKVGAENADKLAKKGYNLDNVIKLSDKGINPEKYAEYGIDSAKDANRAAKYLDEGKNLDEVKRWMNNKRPTWRQSEIDAEEYFPYPEYKQQVYFINGNEVEYGTKGSTRPDFYKPGHSVDVKNYKIESETNRNNLIKNIEKQYRQRLIHLPEGTKQTVFIDTRGQNVSDEILEKIKNDLLNKTDNNIEIIFNKDN